MFILFFMGLSNRLNKEIKLPNNYKLKPGKKSSDAILYNNNGEIIQTYTSGYDLREVREEAFIDFRKRNIGLIYSS